MNNDIMKYTANDGSPVMLDKTSIQKYVITGNAEATDADVVRFMALCQARKLNPLTGDAVMTVYNSQNGPTSSVVVTKEYYNRVMHQNPRYDGHKAGIIVQDDMGQIVYREGCFEMSGDKLLGGWAEVYTKDQRVPTRQEVSLKEYDQKRSIWNTKKATMIRKVAFVQAAREAFPADFGDLYDKSEIDESPVPVQPISVDDAKREREQEHTLDTLRALIIELRDRHGIKPGARTKLLEDEFGCSINEMGLEQIEEAEQMLCEQLAALDAADSPQNGSQGDSGQSDEPEYYEADIEF